jgi:hypothetical protein
VPFRVVLIVKFCYNLRVKLTKKLINMAKETGKKKDSYGADAIQILEGLEPVRKRPGMYIGTTGLDGLHHLIWEIFDNSRDEAMGGFANDIEVTLLPGNRIRVTDNGRGIPVDIHKQTKVSALETIMTTLHAGGKFGGEDGGYKVSGGLHGVGASVVNALSIYCKVTVHKEGDGIYAVILDMLQGKINIETKVHSITKEERRMIVDVLKGLTLTITGLMGFDRAVIADGGVPLSEIDTKTMRSKKIDNLSIIGDLLHVNRPSGGYSLQLCWTTGYVAGKNIGK